MDDLEGVLMVAGDLVEMGRVDEARALLDEQAPHRLARWCPSCGEMAGQPCRDYVYRWEIGTHYPVLVVPHLSRINGPEHLMDRIEARLRGGG